MRQSLKHHLVFVAICCLYVGLASNSMLRNSPTVDEKIHLAGGYSSLITRDFRIDPEHPPFFKYLAGAPLVFKKVPLPLDDASWRNADTLEFGRIFLYRNAVPFESILQPARFFLILSGLVFLFAVYRFSTLEWGYSGGLLSCILFATCPNLLAHSGIVATDFGFAGMSLLCLFALRKTAEEPFKRSSLVLLGVTAGIGLLTKYSFLSWMPLIAAGLALIAWRRPVDFTGKVRWLISNGVIVLAIVAIVVHAGYLGENGLQIYLSGMQKLEGRMSSGHPAFLMGQTSAKGWFHYFAVAFLVKTQPVALVLIFISLIAFAFDRDMRKRAIYTLLPAAYYFLIASISRHNIGIRHILAIYPLLYVWLGYFSSQKVLNHRWMRATILVAVIAAHGSALMAAPHFIAYFNIFAGDRENGWRYLNDSNLDWGQDLKEFARHLERNKDIPKPVFLDYFGDQDLIEKYQLPVRKFTPIEQHYPTKGTFAVSVFNLENIRYSDKKRYEWLKMYEPVSRIGGSIWVYRIDPVVKAPEALRTRYAIERYDALLDREGIQRHARAGWMEVNPEGDWAFPADRDGLTVRCFESPAEILFTADEADSGKELTFNASFYQIECGTSRPAEVAVSLNDRNLKMLSLPPGWTTEMIALPRNVFSKGINLLKFEPKNLETPAERCPPIELKTVAGEKSEAVVFIRIGGSGKHFYRDFIVNGEALQADFESGYLFIVMNPSGSDREIREATADEIRTDPVGIATYLEKIRDGKLVAGVGIRKGDFSLSDEMTAAMKRLGIDRSVNEFERCNHGFITMSGSGESVEKIEEGMAFVYTGPNRDEKPFGFGMKNARLVFKSSISN